LKIFFNGKNGGRIRGGGGEFLNWNCW